MKLMASYAVFNISTSIYNFNSLFCIYLIFLFSYQHKILHLLTSSPLYAVHYIERQILLDRSTFENHLKGSNLNPLTPRLTEIPWTNRVTHKIQDVKSKVVIVGPEFLLQLETFFFFFM